MCAANAVATRDAAGNRKLDKSKATGRIDGLVALAMAFGRASVGAGADDLAGAEEVLALDARLDAARAALDAALGAT
jgi:phage terminase large subunit-like protein